MRRTASKFGARLEPFMVADLQLYEGRSLDIVTQAESLGSYGADIVSDYGSYTAANVMVETADKLTDAEAGLQQYLLLVGALRALARREHDSQLVLDSYLLRALSIAGWAPSFGDCAVTGAPGPHSAFVVQLGVWSPMPRPLPGRHGSIRPRCASWARSCPATGPRPSRPASRRATRPPVSLPPTRSGTSNAASSRFRTSTAPSQPRDCRP
ncbi:hypothetical protein GCM10025867_31510 [Frondihabitans sucicola]|uniref:DNA repair protein RecO n=1 Tax=Frondihabitans sucicola TaxID=1268041 RepID=A0ABN6Y4V2_9MICO|nr:hypothetical protein GCM10025867_31510 [Frondihabitans sucicola]